MNKVSYTTMTGLPAYSYFSNGKELARLFYHSEGVTLVIRNSDISYYLPTTENVNVILSEYI